MKIKRLSHDEDKFRIMYLFPQEFVHSHKAFYTYFLRISNYINSRKEEIPSEFEEILIDLRLEGLPSFEYKNLDEYKRELEAFFSKLYDNFAFNIIALSCYSSYEYLNSVLISYLIKALINPKCVITVGGYHPTFFPEEFRDEKIPSFIVKKFPEKVIPFDYLVKGEGELAFFNLLKHLLNNNLKIDRKNKMKPHIIEGGFFPCLNDLPLIDFSLMKRYKDKLKNLRLNIDFGRGCVFHCKLCLSGKYPVFHKNYRWRAIDKCIEELKIIRETNWLNPNGITISDPIFFPRKSVRESFFKELRILKNSERGFPYKIIVYDRVDVCSKMDLLYYKDLDIEPYFGFESASISMLKNLNKLNSKNDADYEKYIKKMEDLIIFSNEINTNIWIFLIIGLPSETRQTIKDNRDFFIGKRFGGKSLSEQYKIIMDIRYYKAIPPNIIYNECEVKYGGKIYYDKWWRKPLDDHRVYNKIVKPSKELDFLESLRLNYAWVKKYVSDQIKNKTPFFDKGDFKIMREGYFKFAHLYRNGEKDFDLFIPQYWKHGEIYP